MLSTFDQRRVAYVLCFSTIVGLLIAFSSYYDGVNEDTVVAYMASFVRWTPFMWRQDRYGMLIPALTAAIGNPLFNVIAQNALHIFTSAASFFLLARLLYPGPRSLFIGWFSLAAFLLLCGWLDVREILNPWQIYTPALMFGFLSLLTIKRSWWLAFAFAILAEYCNFAIGFLLTLLVLAQAAELWGRGHNVKKYLITRGSLLALAGIVGFLLKRPYSSGGGQYELLPPDQALEGWVHFIADYINNVERTGLWAYFLPALGVCTLVYIFLFHFKRFAKSRIPLRSFIVALFVALAYAMLVGSSKFAMLNGFPRRYLIPSLMFWMVGWSGIMIHLFSYGSRWREWRMAFLGIFVFPLIIARYGTPSLESVQSAMEARFNPAYSQIPKQCTHMVGDYGRVWNSVFYSRIRGERTLWGITYRSEATRDLWDLNNFKNPHICYWRDNMTEAQELLNAFKLTNLQLATQDEKFVDLTPIDFRAANENQ